MQAFPIKLPGRTHLENATFVFHLTDSIPQSGYSKSANISGIWPSTSLSNNVSCDHLTLPLESFWSNSIVREASVYKWSLKAVLHGIKQEYARVSGFFGSRHYTVTSPVLLRKVNAFLWWVVPWALVWSTQDSSFDQSQCPVIYKWSLWLLECLWPEHIILRWFGCIENV